MASSASPMGSHVNQRSKLGPVKHSHSSMGRPASAAAKNRKMENGEKRQMADFFERLTKAVGSSDDKEHKERLKLAQLIKQEIFQETDKDGKTDVQRELERTETEIPATDHNRATVDSSGGGGSGSGKGNATCVYTQHPGKNPHTVNASDPEYLPQVS